MPLSEDDQRLFSEIERSFYAQDPEFQKRVEKTARGPRPAVQVRLAVAGFVVGLVALVALFAQAPVAGFLGFLLMTFSAAIVVDHLRQSSRSRLDAMADTLQAKRDAMGGSSDRLRNPFRR